MSKVLIILSIVLFLSSCGGMKTDFQNEQEFNAYVNDPNNGFIASDETEDLRFESQLVPLTGKENDGNYNFRMRISTKDDKPVLLYNIQNETEKSEREAYLSFGMNEDVFLLVDGKEIPCAFHHYERNYGLKPSIDMFFSFKNVKPKEKVRLVYRDHLFDQGMIEIEFNKDLFTEYYVGN